MNVPHTFDDVLDKVADGASVDWADAERRARSPEDSALLHNLRILARLGDTHRHDSLDGATRDEVVGPAPEPTTPVAEDHDFWGRYRLIRTIGAGSFGTVYLARDEQLDCELALKLLHPGLVSREQVKSEGRALARVDHPNVLTVYGVEEHEGRLALCMKYVRGRTLEEIIRTDGPMNADEALVVGKAICNAVAAVHAAGVLHRDVKARNVMRERNGRYILMDFGAGVMQADDGSSGTEATIGTPVYMAPELLESHPASRRTDVYAIGVLLYFLVSGEYPVVGSSIAALKVAHREGRRTPLDDRRPDLPEHYVRVVDHAIATDPDQRPDTATSLLRELSAGDGATPKQRTWTQRFAVGAAWLLGALVGLTLLGFINSTEFNVMFERTAVAHESIVGWFTWGIRSLIAPVINLTQVLIGVLLVVTIARFIRRLSPPVNRAWLETADRLKDLRRRLLLDDAESFAQMIFVVAVAYVGFVVWRHVDVITAFTTPLSALTREQIQLLSPAVTTTGYESRSVVYRSYLDYAVLGTGWALLRMLRLRRTSAPAVHPAYVAAVAAVFVLSTLLWNAPYRVMFKSQHPRVTYGEARCYDLGRAAEEVLLYCPDSAQPKVRRIPAADSRLKDTGLTESVFAIP